MKPEGPWQQLYHFYIILSLSQTGISVIVGLPGAKQ